jgi:GNAT superfamily N-acetyltransferase
MALDPESEPAGHVGITHAAERDRPHVRIAGRAHLWMLFVRPPWWGTGLARKLHALGLEEAARRGYETIRLYTPEGAARARAFYEREGWAPAGSSFAEPLLGLDLVEYRRGL